MAFSNQRRFFFHKGLLNGERYDDNNNNDNNNNLITIGLGNGLSPNLRQTIFWINDDMNNYVIS